MNRPPLIDRTLWRDLLPFIGRRKARLIPRNPVSGPMPWVIAIMIALMVMAAAAGLALGNLAERARADLSGALTVQILEANAELRAAQARKAADILAADRAVASLRVIPQDELQEMLAPWLGSSAEIGDAVPVPALIDVQLRGIASPAEVARLNARLVDAVPTARVDAQSDWLRPVYDALAALQVLALALIVLLACTAAGAVWLAARSSFTNHRRTVEIVHLLGGTDRQIAQIFQRSITFDALLGGLIGFALGALAVAVIGSQFAAIDSGMVAGGNLRQIDWLVLAAIPVAGVLLATLTARITVMMALNRML
ncbi:MAG: cell division protein FtsX [Erythrobacter sp.]